DERADTYIHYAMDGARRMQMLVKDLLAYSRVDSQGKMPRPIDADAVVRQVITGLQVAIDESRADIVSDKLPIIDADELQLAQIFQNLISNALKFHGDDPPRIRIGAAKDGGRWIFHVQDNGIGIEQQYADVIFQMFKRLHERGRYEGS